MSADRAAVVGLGLLGRGIAACFLGHGFEVVAVSREAQRQPEARCHIGKMIDEMIDLGGFPARLREEWPSRYIETTDFGPLADCSFVVESVTEDVAIKREVFERIEAVVSPKTVIASNSSAIPISQLQQLARRPERFVGMHWAEPAHATRFLELIRGAQTSDEALRLAETLARRLGKEPGLCKKDIPGFIVNRIGYAMYREALHLLESGVADAATIDQSMRNAVGLWATICGPFRWMDLTGGPELYAKAMKPALSTLCNSAELPALMLKLAGNGARGVTNGRGFYDYTPAEAQHWEELYRRHAWQVAQMQDEYFPLPDENKLPRRADISENLSQPKQ
jgi:3-hydroxybutyryl-CoA dehydrogenase